jgi:hypothetical protein
MISAPPKASKKKGKKVAATEPENEQDQPEAQA